MPVGARPKRPAVLRLAAPRTAVSQTLPREGSAKTQ